jgi:hypothetical protein
MAIDVSEDNRGKPAAGNDGATVCSRSGDNLNERAIDAMLTRASPEQTK